MQHRVGKVASAKPLDTADRVVSARQKSERLGRRLLAQRPVKSIESSYFSFQVFPFSTG